MDFPMASQDQVDKHGDKRVFLLSFLRLFTGELGDIKNFPGSMNFWGWNMLYYKDAWFTTDKIFSFFAVNYISYKSTPMLILIEERAFIFRFIIITQ